MHVPYKQFQLGGMTLVVRSSVEPTALAASIRRQVLEMDPEQPIYRERTMQQFLSESQARPAFTTLLLAGFAGLAVLLALVGIYGVISINIAQRTREIGVRMALGAGRADLVQMVIRQGMILAVSGVGLGIAGALALTQLMAGLLFGVAAWDPLTFTIAALLVALASLAATYLPARRATRVDPMVALRYE
jgi:putative ABC transport system permease protein